jgi:hypothetical protein
VQPELYKEYTRDEAVALLHSGKKPEALCGSHLVADDATGSLFALMGLPPNESYWLSPQVFRWFSPETDIQFYNSTMLSFRSRWRTAGRPLHVFGKVQAETIYTYFGQLHIVSSSCPSSLGGAEFPKHIIVQFGVEPRLDPNVWARFDWSQRPVLVNGLPLPKILQRAIVGGSWKFEQAPDAMSRYTDSLRQLYEEGYGENYSIGRQTGDPSILDIDKAICLGATGPDEPLCLDYRDFGTAGRVLWLTGDEKAYWKVLASDIETFIGQGMRVA